MLVVTNVGERRLLEWALRSAGGTLKLKLFTGEVEIGPNTVADDLDEAVFEGYSARTLQRADWAVPFTNLDGLAEIRRVADERFTFGTAQSIWGYYITDADDVLLAAETFEAIATRLAGQQLVVNVGFTLTTSGDGFVVTNAGERTLLDWALRSTGGATTLRLFKSNTSLTATSVKADFTEADFSGYSSKALARASWNASASQLDGSALMEYSSDQVWTPAADQTIYGYHVCNADDVLLWGQKFSTAQGLTTGNNFTIEPKFSLVSEG